MARIECHFLRLSLSARNGGFKTLKEAKAGDIAMQVLVGQMYYNGYGVPKNVQKGHDCINKASKSRASAWKVSDKRPDSEKKREMQIRTIVIVIEITNEKLRMLNKRIFVDIMLIGKVSWTCYSYISIEGTNRDM
ncbi:hypothetical protein GH714_014057 [Hevea brasiliensis]|uniref:Uncharacterized protein n=1 Tax=Hevea brasiliensis TaxID=3981 RepID=A0A6A6N419_HEVBR|nr:hypothetical protein GH714_014057 [Hevea brasiliensis]